MANSCERNTSLAGRSKSDAAGEDYDSRNDFVLRAPLPLVSWNTLTKNAQEQHDFQIAPMISALLVACHVLRLSDETTFTAVCILHRYHHSINFGEPMLGKTNMPRSAKKVYGLDGDCIHDSRLIMVCCICLACKTEEEPRRLRDFINISQMISWDDEQERSTIVRSNVGGAKVINDTNESGGAHENFGTSVHRLCWKKDPPALDETYWAIKEKIVAAEQHVLRWLAFDVCVSHPHRAIIVIIAQHQQQQQHINQDKPLPDHYQQQAIAKHAAYLLNSVAVYSLRALSVPVMSLATAAVTMASERARSTIDFCHGRDMADAAVNTAIEEMKCLMARFSSSR